MRNHGEEINFQERPHICLTDLDSATESALLSNGFNCTSGSLGELVDLQLRFGESTVCRLDFDMPPNLHEYDILVVDTTPREPVPYDESVHKPVHGKAAGDIAINCVFPQAVFNPRPLAAACLQSDISQIPLVLVFASRIQTESYEVVRLTRGGYVPEETPRHNSLAFLPSIPQTLDKTGFRIEVVTPGEPARFTSFLQRYVSEFRYHTIFKHPTLWKRGKSVEVRNFVPLMLNSASEIVSYFHGIDETLVLMFPHLENKASFLLELLQEQLPAVIPHLFPFSTQFVWLEEEIYRLPGEAELLAQKRTLEQEYAERIAAKEEEIEENRQEYQFLHDLLTETGHVLVKAVEKYFRWLGFEDVIDCDELHPQRREEDLKVHLDPGLLVVEVKGIGGTSTDSDCWQISKIRRRRERERRSLDVFGLYVVNHQRYLPPEERQNPPFTEQQIQDARDDERGLLTTYSLFKLFLAVRKGCITKADARSALLGHGLVEFTPPDAALIGKPLEMHYGRTVGIFQLQDTPVRVGDRLIIYENGWCRETEVISLRDPEENEVSEISEGKAGIKLSVEITSESELWKPERTQN